MGFEIVTLNIPEYSPEGEALQRVMKSHKLGPEEAIRHILRGHDQHGNLPAERMLGAFSDPSDAALLDEVVKMAYEMRFTLGRPSTIHQ